MPLRYTGFRTCVHTLLLCTLMAYYILEILTGDSARSQQWETALNDGCRSINQFLNSKFNVWFCLCSLQCRSLQHVQLCPFAEKQIFPPPPFAEKQIRQWFSFLLLSTALQNSRLVVDVARAAVQQTLQGLQKDVQIRSARIRSDPQAFAWVGMRVSVLVITSCVQSWDTYVRRRAISLPPLFHATVFTNLADWTLTLSHGAACHKL